MKKLLTIRLPEDLHYQFKLKTLEEKKSIQEVIENFVKNYLKETTEKKKD
jgi:predicted HicB family RNase H-like nuclease